MDRTILLLHLHSHHKSCNSSKCKCGYLAWLSSVAPFWALLQTCKMLGDYGPPTMLWNVTLEYRIHGVLHRYGGPAVIDCGRYWWYQHGQLHRDHDLPAYIGKDGGKSWYQRGMKHREGDLPAGVYRGRQEWLKYGKKHRGGGLPAVIMESLAQQVHCEWWEYGVKRADQSFPAVKLHDGTLEFLINGRQFYL